MSWDWPGGARVAVSLTFDVDAETGLLARGEEHARRLTALSERRFGAVRGVPRILDILARFGAGATFFVPGRTAELHPGAVERILAAGHEIGHHGHLHLRSHLISPAEQRAEIERGLAALEAAGAPRPTGYRSPAWELTPETLALLLEHGFVYDSSCMGDDRPYVERWEELAILELPVHWSLDDWPRWAWSADGGGALNATEEFLSSWLAEYRVARAEGGHVVFTMHPEVVGRGYRAAALADLVERSPPTATSGSRRSARSPRTWLRASHPLDSPIPAVSSTGVARDPKYDVLFEPVRIGPKTLRNRFYQVPHCTGFGERKPWSQARHRGMKAEGGWAAVCTEFAPISPEGDAGYYPSARMWDEDDVRRFAVMTEDVHAHGALAGIELHHGGIHSANEGRMPLVAPSSIAADGLPFVGMALRRADIRRIQADWAAAARRARSAGFDIVYVYGGHTMLPMQFLSPFFNRRADEYGGTLENRARFWLETLEVVREAVGDDCAIASRISVDELTPATVEVDDALAFVGMADHLVDLWDVNVSSLIEWSKDSGGSRFYPEGYQVQWTGRVKEVASKPVVGVSRVTNADLMVEIVTGGKWDVIGAARPSIADPFLPQKIQDGRLEDVRECIGANQCIANVHRTHHLACSQNATAGEEFRRGWHPEAFTPAEDADRDVLVVGAGPAGMECAIVLARRGLRRVHLVDAAPEPGGHLRWLSRLPGLGQWARVVNHRTIQLGKLKQVEVVPGTRLDAAAVREYGADLVVVATGATWAADGLNAFTRGPIPGADASLPHVLTPEQVVAEGKRPPGRRVLVYDGEGYVVAPGLAELLLAEGYEVEIVTGLGTVAPFADEHLEGELLREHLHRAGIRSRTATTVTEIHAGGVRAEDIDGAVEIEADAVVLATQRLPDERLFLELDTDPDALAAAGIQGLFRIGDCTAPRWLADAVFDGHRLAREIDSADPSLPLPFRRELALGEVEAPAALAGARGQ